MKRAFAILLALMLLAFAACEGTPPPIPSGTDVVTTSPTDIAGTAPNGATASGRLTAIDNDECRITIMKVDPEDRWGLAIEVQLENKSDEKTYLFTVDSAAINRLQIEPLWAKEAAPGETADSRIEFDRVTLEEYGLTRYTDIELTFRVYDSNDWLAESVANETVHIYPYGEGNAEAFVREPRATDVVIVDNEYVTAAALSYGNDEILGFYVEVFLFNKSDKNVFFSVDKATVNGVEADPYFADTLAPGYSTFNHIMWLARPWEESGPAELQEIVLLFTAVDLDNLMGDYLANEIVVLYPRGANAQV